MFRYFVSALFVVPFVANAGQPGPGFLSDSAPYDDSYLTAAPVVNTKAHAQGTLPVETAVDAVLPKGTEWTVYVHEDVRGEQVTVSEHADWQHQLNTMIRGAGLGLAASEADKAYFVASTSKQAKAMADAISVEASTAALPLGAPSSDQSIDEETAVYKILLSDGTLSRAITRWAFDAGWTLDWQAKQVDYPITSEADFKGSLEDAVSSAFIALSKTGSSLGVSFAPNKHMIVHPVQ